MYLDIEEIVSYKPGRRSFLGCDNETVARIGSQPDYEKLDSLVSIGKWSKNENGYYFTTIWGNGLPAPPGEREEEDRMFSIWIHFNSDTIIIDSGRW